MVVEIVVVPVQNAVKIATETTDYTIFWKRSNIHNNHLVAMMFVETALTLAMVSVH